ncbi:MAG: ATP-binding protein [Nakamurella sp.]
MGCSSDASEPDTSEVGTAFLISRSDTGETVFASAAFETITGYPVSTVVGVASPLSGLVHPDDLQCLSAYTVAFRAGRPAQLRARIIRADGESRWIRLASTPLPADDGAPRTVTSWEDITARVTADEAAETAARAAHRAKSALVSRLGHELRNPLNAVIGFAQLLERRLTDLDDLSSVQYILSSGRHLLEMIDEVLDITRIDADTLSLTADPVEAPALVDEVVDLVQPRADRSRVRIAVEGGPAGLRFLGDRPRLVQVLQNLLTTAIADNRPGGHLWISWSALGGASVTVRDDGPGISREQHERLLTPADRVGVGPVPAPVAGVGLAVTRALIELMGGTLSFESAPGAGSSFSLALPCAPDRRATVGSAETGFVPTEQGSEASTLLYIGDNPPHVRTVSAMLRLRPGWHLLHTGLGADGVELARSRRPDLVLLDMHLPDRFGLSVLETLKADPATSDIPVVVLSTDAGLPQVDRLLQAGAAQHLTKPLDTQEVLMLLDGITADPQTRMVDA